MQPPLAIDALADVHVRAEGLLHLAPQAAIDNGTSDRYTIVEIFADDRQGLLYEITHALFEMGLSIASAKISTRLDQVVDAFYVTERATGGKLPDEKVAPIVERLKAVITSA